MKLTQTKLIGSTIVLAAAVAFTGLGHQTAFAKQAAPPNALSAVAQGKSLTAKYTCSNCHGDNLAGRKGFSPSLHASGVLREYNLKTFERVMDTGITNDGGHVKKPMPVYHMPATKSAPIYAYLKTLK